MNSLNSFPRSIVIFGTVDVSNILNYDLLDNTECVQYFDLG